ncbi:hypothetical protein [Nostoc piscinale]|nr:hypothetical protein [Nostoc piscinale]
MKSFNFQLLAMGWNSDRILQHEAINVNSNSIKEFHQLWGVSNR